jgi:hypothetical protein
MPGESPPLVKTAMVLGGSGMMVCSDLEYVEGDLYHVFEGLSVIAAIEVVCIVVPPDVELAAAFVEVGQDVEDLHEADEGPGVVVFEMEVETGLELSACKVGAHPVLDGAIEPLGVFWHGSARYLEFLFEEVEINVWRGGGWC